MVAVRFISAAVLALAVALSAAGQLRAGELPKSPTFLAKLGVPPDRVDFSNGGEKTETSTSTYGSATIAPFGSLNDDGWRMKLYGSYAAFSYLTTDNCQSARFQNLQGKRPAPFNARIFALCDALPGMSADARRHIGESIAPLGLEIRGGDIYHPQTHAVTRVEGAIMPGYQMAVGSLVLKGYAGVGYETTSITPIDHSKMNSGGAWGARGALESWLTLSDVAWLSADGSYFTGTNRYAATARLGFQALSWLTLGPELAAFGDRDDNTTRKGGFLRFNIGQVETTLSAGQSQQNFSDEANLYGSASAYVKF